jgi:hypothetical protein
MFMIMALTNGEKNRAKKEVEEKVPYFILRDPLTNQYKVVLLRRSGVGSNGEPSTEE